MVEKEFDVKVHGKLGVLPFCMEDGSVGYDVALPEDFGNLVIPYSSRRTVDTGIIVCPNIKCFTLVVPRSSSRKKGIRISNTVGVIDPSYRGQDDTIKVDITREPKKSNYVGKLTGEEVSGVSDMFDTGPEMCTQAQYVFSKVSDIPMKDLLVVTDPEEMEYHFYQETPDETLVYRAGERFCQFLFIPYHKPDLLLAKLEEFEESNRGGFGSTGK